MDLLEDDARLRELAFLIIAVMIHGAVLGSGFPGAAFKSPAASAAVAVDFVASLPAAPAPAAPTPAPAPKPAAQRPAPAAAKPAAAPRRRARRAAHPRVHRAVRRRADPAVLAARKAAALARAQARAEARTQAARAARQRSERLAAARRAAEVMAAEQAVRVAAAARAKAQAAAAARAETVRLKAAAREQARAERRARRIEVSRELAALKDPDEVLADAPNDPALAPGPSAAAEDPDTLAGSGGRGMGAALPAASLDSEALYEVQRDGYDPEAAESKGGGGGIAWSVEGPLGNRRITRKVLPESPSWVSERGLELAVSVRFQILPDGRVKPGAVIRKTSGFPEIDRRALEALKRWKFEVLPGRDPGPDAWGSVTFKFLMG